MCMNVPAAEILGLLILKRSPDPYVGDAGRKKNELGMLRL